MTEDKQYTFERLELVELLKEYLIKKGKLNVNDQICDKANYNTSGTLISMTISVKYEQKIDLDENKKND